MSSNTSTAADSYLDLGVGVDLGAKTSDTAPSSDSNFSEAVFAGKSPSSIAEETKAPVTKKEKQTTVALKDDLWHDQATYADQFLKFPQHCKLEGPKFKQFDAITQEQELDDFMLQTNPEGSPAILIESIEKQFGATSESWKILVIYHKVKYRKLLDKGTK